MNAITHKNDHGGKAARALQERLGYKFRNDELLERALTHASWANLSGHGCPDNERQEFLGDAVLELCVSSELYQRFPDATEGEMTRMRALLVSGASLAPLAREVGIEAFIRLGSGSELQDGGAGRDSVLGDALEAVLGAIYEDGGFYAAQKCVKKIFSAHWPDRIGEKQTRDCKSLLQQISQRFLHGFPVYALVGAHGAEHEKIFDVSLTLPDGRVFYASGSSCKRAEQEAAAIALETLNIVSRE